MSEGLALPVVDCWNAIGVKGDRSCPKLKEVTHCHNCQVFADAARSFLDRPAPAGYLVEVTEGFAGVAETQTPESVSVLLFEVGDQLLAIDTRAVVEVTSPRGAHRVSHRHGRVFAGIVNIHGQLELCASLAGLLQIEAGPAASTATTGSPSARMLLVAHLGFRWSFEVAAVHGVHRFEALDVSPVPATSQQDAVSFIKSVLRFGQRHAGYLDLDKTFRGLESSLR